MAFIIFNVVGSTLKPPVSHAPKTLPPVTTKPTTAKPTHTCSNTEMMCASNGKCIAKLYMCDGIQDCTDGSDEPASCRKFNYRKIYMCTGNKR